MDCKKVTFIIVNCFLFVSLLCAQPGQLQMYKDTVLKRHRPRLLTAMAEMQGDSVVLRWNSGDAATWLAGKTSGYVIRRFEVDSVHKQLLNASIITTKPVMPWPLEQFKAIFETSHDTTLAAAAEVVYNSGRGPVLKENTDVADVMDNGSQQNDMRLYGQLIACFSPVSARAMGMAFVDKKIIKGKEYFYQVYLAPNNLVNKNDTGYTAINTSRPTPLLQMPPILADAKDMVAQFTWEKNIYGNFFVAYVIERSEDGGKTFKPTHKLPLLETSTQGDNRVPVRVSMLRDSLPKNYIAYQYRIRGINAFGNLSLPSNVVTVTGQYLTAPPIATITNTKNSKDNMVNIEWKIPKASNIVAGFLIGRGEGYEGPFTPIVNRVLPPTTFSYIDSSASTNKENYYIITTFDTAGNFSNSYPAHVTMIDTFPPDAPVILFSKIDSTGKVFINWKKPVAPDVAGYLVQRANALNHNFITVSKGFLTDTSYVDSISINSLTRHIYYRVLAYDRVRNASNPSNIIEISKPDAVAPVAAVFINYETTDTSIQLSWNKSTSTDLCKQLLYRRAKEDDWTVLASLGNNQVTYTDTTVQNQVLYSYQIVSIDSAGLKSDPSFPVNIKTFFKASTNTQGELKANLLGDSTGIKIEWVLKNGVRPANILLYRSVNGGVLSMYKTVPAVKGNYIDKSINTGNTYSYSFKCVFDAGNEDMLSKEATVVIKK